MTPTTLSRTTINLSQPQLSWLKKEAKRTGVTLGEYLRRIIDQRREHMEAVRSAQAVQAARKTQEAQ